MRHPGLSEQELRRFAEICEEYREKSKLRRRHIARAHQLAKEMSELDRERDELERKQWFHLKEKGVF